MKYFVITTFLLISFSSCFKSNRAQDANQKILDVTTILKYQDPILFKDQAYCYYVFQEIINPKEITPDLFSKYMKGGTLGLKHIAEYSKWLSSAEGKNCKKIVGYLVPLRKRTDFW